MGKTYANLKVPFLNKKMDFTQEKTDVYDYYMDNMLETKNTKGARTAKSLYFTISEKEMIDEFCANNNIQLPSLIRWCWWQAGAINDQLILAINDQRDPYLEFLDIKKEDLDFSHLKKWRQKDWNEIMKEKGKAVAIGSRSLITQASQYFYVKNKWPTWAMFTKSCLLDLGVYPSNAISIVKSHFRVIDPNIDAKLTPSQLRTKKLRQQKNAEKKKRFKANPKDKSTTIKLNISTLNFEQGLLDKFKESLKNSGLSLSAIVKHRLKETGLVPDIPDVDVSAFNFTPDHEEKSRMYYENERKEALGGKRNTNNIALQDTTKDAIFEKIGRSNFPSWVRKHVLDFYGVYPTDSRGTSVADLFIYRDFDDPTD